MKEELIKYTGESKEIKLILREGQLTGNGLLDVDKAADAGKISYKTASNYLPVISSKWDEPLSITPP